MPYLKIVNGIGRKNVDKLREIGIETTSTLLDKAALPAKRVDLASKLKIDTALILKWVIYSDFFRIKGMRSKYVELLQAADIDTVQVLALYEPEELYDILLSVNTEKNLVGKMPSLKQLQNWIIQAGELPAVIWFDGMYCRGI